MFDVRSPRQSLGTKPRTNVFRAGSDSADIGSSSTSDVVEEGHGDTGVCEQNTPFMRALAPQSGSNNCSPAVL